MLIPFTCIARNAKTTSLYLGKIIKGDLENEKDQCLFVGMEHCEIDEEAICDGIIQADNSKIKPQFIDPISLSVMALVGVAAIGGVILVGAGTVWAVKKGATKIREYRKRKAMEKIGQGIEQDSVLTSNVNIPLSNGPNPGPSKHNVNDVPNPGPTNPNNQNHSTHPINAQPVNNPNPKPINSNNQNSSTKPVQTINNPNTQNGNSSNNPSAHNSQNSNNPVQTQNTHNQQNGNSNVQGSNSGVHQQNSYSQPNNQNINYTNNNGSFNSHGSSSGVQTQNSYSQQNNQNANSSFHSQNSFNNQNNNQNPHFNQSGGNYQNGNSFHNSGQQNNYNKLNNVLTGNQCSSGSVLQGDNSHQSSSQLFQSVNSNMVNLQNNGSSLGNFGEVINPQINNNEYYSNDNSSYYSQNQYNSNNGSNFPDTDGLPDSVYNSRNYSREEMARIKTQILQGSNIQLHTKTAAIINYSTLPVLVIYCADPNKLMCIQNTTGFAVGTDVAVNKGKAYQAMQAVTTKLYLQPGQVVVCQRNCTVYYLSILRKNNDGSFTLCVQNSQLYEKNTWLITDAHLRNSIAVIRNVESFN